MLKISFNGTIWTSICTHFEVFLDGHVREHAAALRALRKAKLYDLVGGHVVDRRTHKLDRARLRAEQARNRIQNGTLACAVCADQCDDFALVDFKGDAFDRVNCAIIDMKIIDGKQHISALLFFAEVRFDTAGLA